MVKITMEQFVAQINVLLNYVKRNTIPYVLGGMSMAGMDCQGLVEWCLMQAGIPKSECNYAGSNAHYRACVWTGSPEECKKAFGEVPAGAALFILEQDGNEPDKYKADGIGNASHIGLWTGKTSIAASASKGKVIESNFRGRSINGGWNRVGLLPWVDYGLTMDQAAVLTKPETLATTAKSTLKPMYSHLRFELGCMGDGTREIQTALNLCGADPALHIDGEFGEKTDAAVRAFQRSKGLTTDGIVGRDTWAALIAQANKA